MSIEVTCQCGKMLRVKDEFIGKSILCPSCGEAVMVGDRQSAEPGGDAAAAEPGNIAGKGGKRKTIIYASIGVVGLVAIAITLYLVFFQKSLSDVDKDKPGPSKVGNKKISGSLDVVDSGHITGWAWDPEQPNDPLKVDIYDNDVLLITLPADQFRKDLAKFAGNGKHRFLYQIPPKMRDGKDHEIRVKVSGTDIELRNSPKTATFKRR